MVTSDEEWFVRKLGFNRGLIRRSEKFIEKDFQEVNPRKLLRNTRREIQDLARDEEKFKFKVKDDPIEVSKESVGEASGFVRAGIKAHFERPDHDGGVIKYRPYRSKGVLGMTLGSIMLITGAAVFKFTGLPQTPSIASSAIGIILLLAGAYAYRYSEYETFNINIVNKLRAMINGEVTEEKVEKDSGTETKVKGDVAMMFAADTDIELLSIHEYKSVLDKEDVKNTTALVNAIEDLKDEIYQEIYLDNWEDIPKPIPRDKVKNKNYSELENELLDEFPAEQISRWITEKLKEKNVVEEHVIDQSKEDLRKVKEEAQDLARKVQDHVN